MKHLHKKILGIIVLLVLIAWLIHYGLSNYSSFKEVSFENPWLLIIIGIIFLLGYIPVSVITYYLLAPFNVKLGKKESFGLSIVTGFYNLIMPFRGGMAVRGIYLKKKYGFSYTNFLATLAASYILTFFIASILGLFSVLNIYLTKNIISWPIFTIFSGMFLIFLIVIVLSPKIPETKYKFVNHFISTLNGWHLIKNKRNILLAVIIMSVVQLLLSALNLLLQFKVFGIDITLGSAIFLSAMGALSMIVGITPAGLGINEAIIVFSASTLGITPIQSLSATLAGRFVGFIVLFILGPIFSYLLIKKGGSNDKENSHK
ncbi:flippase-like domain-containing protein [Candidatus Pacearchaeota archaeon]|nr:flippase-like domain-containing protein [Candidatus Pacearchaeota archaeon]